MSSTAAAATQVYGWMWMTMTGVRPHRTPAVESHAAHRTLKSPPPPSPVGIPDWLGLALAEEERIIAVQKCGRWLLGVTYLSEVAMELERTYSIGSP